jgi:hypothetical protein
MVRCYRSGQKSVLGIGPRQGIAFDIFPTSFLAK